MFSFDTIAVAGIRLLLLCIFVYLCKKFIPSVIAAFKDKENWRNRLKFRHLTFFAVFFGIVFLFVLAIFFLRYLEASRGSLFLFRGIDITWATDHLVLIFFVAIFVYIVMVLRRSIVKFFLLLATIFLLVFTLFFVAIFNSLDSIRFYEFYHESSQSSIIIKETSNSFMFQHTVSHMVYVREDTFFITNATNFGAMNYPFMRRGNYNLIWIDNSTILITYWDDYGNISESTIQIYNRK